jgi:hypothetical protein
MTGDLFDREAFLAQAPYLLPVKDQPRPTYGFTGFSPVDLGVLQAGLNPLFDDVPFKFRHRGDDGEDHLSHRCGGIQGFLGRDESNPKAAELSQSRDKLLYTPGKTVKSPNKNHVKDAAASILHQGVEARPALFCAAHPIRIDAGNRPSALLRKLSEGNLLNLRILFKRGILRGAGFGRSAYPDVYRCSFHVVSFFGWEPVPLPTPNFPKSRVRRNLPGCGPGAKKPNRGFMVAPQFGT